MHAPSHPFNHTHHHTTISIEAHLYFIFSLSDYFAIKKLKGGHAAGPDGIPLELMSSAMGPVSSALNSMFIQVIGNQCPQTGWMEPR